MDVFVIGAGFSKAISKAMPTLGELTAQVRQERPELLDGLDSRIFQDDIESILTYLATPQPWLTEETQLVNKSRFLGLSAEIGRWIEKGQEIALASDPPPWLLSLVGHWDGEQCTVLTFNYDLLIEKAVCELQSDAHRSAGFDSLYPVPATPLHKRAEGMRLGGSPIDTFQLLRPHGSIGWCYSGRESFYGETIYQTWSSRGWRRDDSKEMPDYGRDKVPLIIPPTSSKTGFFNSEFIETQWREAAHAIEDAQRIYFLGYSLPPTDTGFRFLLGTVGEGSTAIVVNRDVDVVDRYRSVFAEVDDTFVGGTNPIDALANSLTT